MCFNAFRESKGITLREQLIKKGFRSAKNFGTKISILRQYSDFPKDIDNLSEWCQKYEKMTESNNEDQQRKFEEFCFETIASTLENGGDLAILRDNPTDENEDRDEWNNSWNTFKDDYQGAKLWKPSDNWTNSLTDLKEFKKQCKRNERKPLTNEKDILIEEVKRYCTRRVQFTNQNSWSFHI